MQFLDAARTRQRLPFRPPIGPGRTSRGGRTVFESVGSALEDLVAAILAHGADAGAGH